MSRPNWTGWSREESVRDDGIRRRVAESCRLLGSHVTGVSDDDLLAKLRGLEVNAERGELGGAMRRNAVRRGSPQRAAQAA